MRAVHRFILSVLSVLLVSACSYFDTAPPADTIVVDEVRPTPAVTQIDFYEAIRRNTGGRVEIYKLDGASADSPLLSDVRQVQKTSYNTDGQMYDILPSKALPPGGAMQGTPASLSNQDVDIFPLFGGDMPVYGYEDDALSPPPVESVIEYETMPDPSSFK